MTPTKIKTLMLHSVSGEELVALVQQLFDKVYDTKIRVRGSYKGKTCYVFIPSKAAKVLDIRKGLRLKAYIDNGTVVYEESKEGDYDVKDYGCWKQGVYYPAYYVKFPLRVKNMTPAKIIVESTKPLRFRVVLKDV